MVKEVGAGASFCIPGAGAGGGLCYCTANKVKFHRSTAILLSIIHFHQGVICILLFSDILIQNVSPKE
jgi:hypothetical protein